MTQPGPQRNPVTVSDEQLAARCLKGRIVVIDDDGEILAALAALFALEGYACETYTSALDYLQIRSANRSYFPGPCCVLSDVKMPGLDGHALQSRLAELDTTPLLLMSGAGSVTDAVSAFRSGAVDFLIKPIETEHLLASVRKALAANTLHLQQRQRHSHLTTRIGQLTDRERDIARRVAAGQTNPVIAEELGIALRTVKLHRQRALEKLGAQSTVELARIADEGGL
jgi:two-component system, LuxR family, response regulator FixJ